MGRTVGRISSLLVRGCRLPSKKLSGQLCEFVHGLYKVRKKRIKGKKVMARRDFLPFLRIMRTSLRVLNATTALVAPQWQYL